MNDSAAHHRSKLRIGTRGSRLVRWQAEWVADRLRGSHPGLTVELVEIKTQATATATRPWPPSEGQGCSPRKSSGPCSMAWSMWPCIASRICPPRVPRSSLLPPFPREDVADALIAPVHRTLEALPQGARVGTSSLRRRAQLLHLRPDLSVETIRGNVETRLNQALTGKFDAVILAWAGLHRLGLHEHVTQRLAPPSFLPAVGQGALGIECRRDDRITGDFLRPLDDPATHRAVLAERCALGRA